MAVDPNEDPPGVLAVDEDDPNADPPGVRIPVNGHSRAPRGSKAKTEEPGTVYGRPAIERAFPAIGGIAGGLAAGIPGATIGGMAGKAAQIGPSGLKGLVGIRPSDPEAQALAADQLKEIARAGVEQGAFQAVGTGAIKGLGLLGKGMMRAALKADPRIAQTAIAEGISATSGGLQRLGTKLSQSASQTKKLIEAATQSGVRFPTVNIASETFQSIWPTASNRALAEPAQKQVVKMTTQFLKSHGAEIDASKLQLMKQQADEAIERYYSKTLSGKKTGSLPLVLQWQKAFVDKARTLLETIPGVAESNARTKALIEVKGRLFPVLRNQNSVLAQVVAQGTRPAIGAGVGSLFGASPADRIRNAAIGAGAGAMAGPGVQSQLALMANNPMLANLLVRTPLAGANLLLTGQEPQSTGP